MKTITRILIALFLTGGISSIASAQEKAPVKWKEKEDYHAVMAATFHPMEEGNFKPIHERAAELAAKALAWNKSVFPKEFDKPELRKTMDELVKGSDEMAALVKKNAGEDVLREKMNALHGTFHKIVGLCEHGHETGEHESEPKH